MQEVDHHPGDRIPVWIVSVAAGAGIVLVGALFWMVWRSQFAAQPGYLFGTPTQPVEAGYCLAVAQSFYPGGPPTGGYVAEAADFWVGRLRFYGGDLAGAIAAGQARLSRDLTAARGKETEWIAGAMDGCSRRALNYGAKFKAFD